MNEQLMNEIRKINFDKYPAHYPESGINYVNPKDGLVLVDVGGGGTTKNHLSWVAEKKVNAEVISIDLCTPPRTDMTINGKFVSISGAGDYSTKTELYKQLCDSAIIPHFFTYINQDAYEYFKTFDKKIDLFYDDGTHHSDYLIPLFERVLPFCNNGAIIGSHDMQEKEMKEFGDWLLAHPNLELIKNTGQSILLRVKK